MSTRTFSEESNDLVDELKQLEDFFPLLGAVEGYGPGVSDEDDELREEIRELEELIAEAGEAEDEQSMKALTFLQTELLRKRELLEGF